MGIKINPRNHYFVFPVYRSNSKSDSRTSERYICAVARNENGGFAEPFEQNSPQVLADCVVSKFLCGFDVPEGETIPSHLLNLNLSFSIPDGSWERNWDVGGFRSVASGRISEQEKDSLHFYTRCAFESYIEGMPPLGHLHRPSRF